MKPLLVSLLKTLTCGIVFFVGTMVGGIAAGWLGLPAPAMPEGSEPGALAGHLFLASLGMGALLAFLAGRLRGRFWARWLVLAFFGWVIYSFTTYVEAKIYTTFSSASLYKVVMDLVAFVVSGGLAAGWFAPHGNGVTSPLSQMIPLRSPQAWAWRLAVAWAAFPVIYLAFGKVVEPLVIDVYRQGQLEMTAPGWGQIVPAQMLRSLLFLLVCLAVMFRWQGSRRALLSSLAVGMFLLVGGLYMLQAYWFPPGFRLVHSLEILADSVVYALCLGALFTPLARPAGAQAQSLRVG